MQKIKIGNHFIGKGCACFIIAEAGVNHNGSLRLAKKMVDVAKASGADAVKFQTFFAADLVTAGAPMADYQKINFPLKSHFKMLKQLELKESEFKGLKEYCRRKKIIFLSSPFENRSAEFLFRLGVPAFKLASGELTNLALLEKIAKYKKPVILSTGMSTLKEISEAVKVIYSTGNRRLIILHCTSNYPAAYEEVHLKAMQVMKDKFNTPVGYSDHTLGIEVPVAAVAMGASVLEKHFTLNRNQPGPDQKSSLLPEELTSMVRAIRNTEKALGSAKKIPQKSEIIMKNIARKSIVAAVKIPSGVKITAEMLSIKRPGSGIVPKYLPKIINRYAQQKIKAGQLVDWKMLK